MIALFLLACSGEREVAAPEAAPVAVPAPQPSSMTEAAPVEGHWLVHISEENLAGLENMKAHAEAHPDDARAAMMVDMLEKLAERELKLTPTTISFVIKGEATILNGTLSPTETGWQFEAPDAGKVFQMKILDDGMLEMAEEGKEAQQWKRPA